MTSEEMVDLCVAALEDLKAEDIEVLDVRDLTTMTDYMVIASGSSSRKVKAMAGSVMEAAKARGLQPIGSEGEQTCDWILVDLGNVIVHAMQREPRLFYQLEKLWSSTEREQQIKSM